MRSLVLLVTLVVFNPFGMASENQDRVIEGTCGDHWFKVHFIANQRTKEVELEFLGDSGADAQLKGTLVKEEEETSFRINFNTKEKGYLYIDGSDYQHNIYWGTLSKTGRPEDAVGLGLCSIN